MCVCAHVYIDINISDRKNVGRVKALDEIVGMHLKDLKWFVRFSFTRVKTNENGYGQEITIQYFYCVIFKII